VLPVAARLLLVAHLLAVALVVPAAVVDAVVRLPSR